MFRTSHSVDTLATPDEIWALVKDVTQWSSWLLGVDKVKLNGPLVSGMQGLLYLGGGDVHPMFIQSCGLGHLGIVVNLRFGVKMNLIIDIVAAPPGSKVRLEGELSGTMSILHVWGWGKNLRTGLVPTTRRLGVLAQGMYI